MGSSSSFYAGGSAAGSQSVKDLKKQMYNKILEKKFRVEAINTKEYSSWTQVENKTAVDPYVEDKNSLCMKNRIHHKELTKDYHYPMLKTRTSSY